MSTQPTTDPTSVDRIAVAFVAALREVGIDVPVGSALTFYEALGALGIAEREPVYWAGRATLVHHPNEIEPFDLVFAAFWEGDPSASAPKQVEEAE